MVFPTQVSCLSGVFCCSYCGKSVSFHLSDLCAFQSCKFLLRIPHFFQLEAIEVILTCKLDVGRVVISLFGPDVEYETDGEQVEIRDRNPDLHAPQQKQRRGQLTLGRSQFFLALTSVNRFAPQSSRISGSTS